MNIVATRETKAIARRLLERTPERGASATLQALERVKSEQVPALIAVLAEAACIKAKVAPTRKALAAARGQAWRERILIEDEMFASHEDRKRAHGLYHAGIRTDFAITGERAYHRFKQRAKTGSKARAIKPQAA